MFVDQLVARDAEVGFEHVWTEEGAGDFSRQVNLRQQGWIDDRHMEVTTVLIGTWVQRR